jgi:hypothetical protein
MFLMQACRIADECALTSPYIAGKLFCHHQLIGTLLCHQQLTHQKAYLCMLDQSFSHPIDYFTWPAS